MAKTLLTIPVDEDIAELYYQALPEDRYKMEFMISFWLRDVAYARDNPEEAKARLTTLMEQISEKAQARGMTPEILAEILAEDD